MRKIQFGIIIIVLSCACAFGQKKGYWAESNFSGFDATKTYKIAILPVVCGDAELTEADLTNLAYNEISLKLSGISKFQVINKQVTMEAVNTYRFGGGPVSASNYSDICKATGAQLLVYCELSRDATTIKKKEISTVMAWIQIFNSETAFSAVYTGRARSINPLSKQAEMEGAVRKALEALVTKMQ